MATSHAAAGVAMSHGMKLSRATKKYDVYDDSANADIIAHITAFSVSDCSGNPLPFENKKAIGTESAVSYFDRNERYEMKQAKRLIAVK